MPNSAGGKKWVRMVNFRKLNKMVLKRCKLVQKLPFTNFPFKLFTISFMICFSKLSKYFGNRFGLCAGTRKNYQFL